MSTKQSITLEEAEKAFPQHSYKTGRLRPFFKLHIWPTIDERKQGQDITFEDIEFKDLHQRVVELRLKGHQVDIYKGDWLVKEW